MSQDGAPQADVQLNILGHSFTAPSWDKIAAGQNAVKVEPQHIIDSPLGTVFAFRDRNNVSLPLDRKIFVVRGDDNNVFLFDEDGTVLDEPDAFTPGGVQTYASIPLRTHQQTHPSTCRQYLFEPLTPITFELYPCTLVRAVSSRTKKLT